MEKIVKIKSNSNCLLVDYPRHKEIKNELLISLENYEDKQNKSTPVKATVTDWRICTEEIKKLQTFVFEKIDENRLFVWDNCRLSYQNFWANIYRKGDYAESHHHLPNQIAFVYFLKSEKHFSPLVFDDSKEEIIPEEGKLFIFPAHLMHHVPPHDSEDTRITLSGNIQIYND